MKPNCFFLRLDRSKFKNGYYRVLMELAQNSLSYILLLLKQWHRVLNYCWYLSFGRYTIMADRNQVEVELESKMTPLPHYSSWLFRLHCKLVTPSFSLGSESWLTVSSGSVTYCM